MVLKILKLPELTKSFPAEVKTIFQIFNSEIRLVGGCVRDLLLKKKIADFDFATKLSPNQIIKILEKNHLKAIPTGIKFGTITAVVNHKNFEITTLRKDNQRVYNMVENLCISQGIEMPKINIKTEFFL